MKDIVIVDDAQDQLLLLEVMLNQRGYEPTTFLDPIKALEHIKKKKPDLLITDYSMPQMNGIELIYGVKCFHPSLKTAIISALKDETNSLREECDRLDSPLLKKPFDSLEFQGFIKAIFKDESQRVVCIKDKSSECILRDKVCYKHMSCCYDDMVDEREVIQNAIDALDDFVLNEQMLIHVSTKLSYMANIVNYSSEVVGELLNILRQLVVMMHEHRERILQSSDIAMLVSSYLIVIREWLYNTFIVERALNHMSNYQDSIKADFQSIEMALGLCVIPEVECAELDDLFF